MFKAVYRCSAPSKPSKPGPVWPALENMLTTTKAKLAPCSSLVEEGINLNHWVPLANRSEAERGLNKDSAGTNTQ